MFHHAKARSLDAHFSSASVPNYGDSGYIESVFNNRSASAHFLRLYNAFSDPSPSSARAFWEIKRAFHHYLDAYPSIDRDEHYAIHGWYTCFDEADVSLEMPFHVHAGNTISGNLAVSASPCAGTDYAGLRSPEDTFGKGEHPAPSTAATLDGRDSHTHLFSEGRLVLFHGASPHRVARERESPECAAWWGDAAETCSRVSLAFDIAAWSRMPTLFSAVPIYDPLDPDFADDPERHETKVGAVQAQLVEMQRSLQMEGNLHDVPSLQRDYAAFLAAMNAQMQGGGSGLYRNPDQ
ncbi:hypothetical protein TeGR_g1187 [Tetraparma gracilis]|uniref:Phytanoyl-CoA dioxygenase n=1 Tax=Tetraparma gracilis TaxID=2962635 RepID=A0ABQ6NCR5_9STRA|nr:hypothetical protein TeGR_g1187 [Tetraparma gracilis]